MSRIVRYRYALLLEPGVRRLLAARDNATWEGELAGPEEDGAGELPAPDDVAVGPPGPDPPVGVPLPPPGCVGVPAGPELGAVGGS